MIDDAQFSETAQWTYARSDDVQSYERTRPTRDTAMPVGAQRSARNGALKTAASRRAARRISRAAGGTHRRRSRKMQW